MCVLGQPPPLGAAQANQTFVFASTCDANYVVESGGGHSVRAGITWTGRDESGEIRWPEFTQNYVVPGIPAT